MAKGIHFIKAHWLKASLANKISLASVALTLLVAFAVGGVAQSFTRQYILESVDRELREELRIYGQRVSLYLEAASHNLESLSKNSLTMNALVDSTGRDTYLKPFLEEFIVSDKLKIDVGLYDFSGKLIASSANQVEKNIAQENVFKNAIEGIAFSDFHAHGQEGYLAIAYPVYHRATNMVEGVLLARIDIVNVFDDEFMQKTKLHGAELFVKLRNDKTEIISSSLWPNEDEMLVKTLNIPLEGALQNMALNLLVGEEKDKAYAPLVSLGYTIASVAFFVILISIFMSRLMGQALARPIIELSFAARQIVKNGDLEQPLPEKKGADEVGRLTQSFQEMLEHIKNSYDLLENRVVERTRALEKAREYANNNAIKLSATINNVMDGIINIDEYGYIQSVNNSTAKKYGCSLDQLLNHVELKIENIFAPTYRSYFLEELKAYRDGKAHHLFDGHTEAEGIRMDGSFYPIEISISEVLVTGKPLLTVVIRDISERKETERAKDEFISSVSHELRTPITSIRGALGLMKANKKNPLVDKTLMLVNLAYKNCERLEALVNDILDIERMDSGKLEFNREPIDIVNLVKQAIEVSKPYASSYDKTIRYWPSLDVALILGDEGRLNQVMNNLLSNGAKYSADNAVVEVFVTRVEEHIRISVVNSGIGIDMKFRKRIFTRFAQADSSDTRKIGGSGLGLAITKAIVERHDGIIHYLTKFGYGIGFYIDFPIFEGKCQVLSGFSPNLALCGPESRMDSTIISETLKQRCHAAPVVVDGPALAVIYEKTGAFRRSVMISPSEEEVSSFVEKSARENAYPLIWLSDDVSNNKN